MRTGKNWVAYLALVLCVVILPACGSSDGSSGENTTLSIFRTHEKGVIDHFYEHKRAIVDDEHVVTYSCYAVSDDRLTHEMVWEVALSPTNSRAHHVTGTLVQGDSLFYTGYYTSSMDDDLSELSQNSLANGFLIQVDRNDGSILGAVALRSQTEVFQSTVVPKSVTLEDGDIVVIGESSGGLNVEYTQLEPESALDQFEVVFDSSTLDVLSASLTPLSTEAAVQGPLYLSMESKKSLFDTITDYLETSVVSWTGSEIIKGLGIQSSMSKEVGQINSELETITTNINQMQQELGTLLSGFEALYNDVLSSHVSTGKTICDYLTTDITNAFSGYKTAINNALPSNATEDSLTLEMIASNEDAMKAFAGYFNGYDGVTAQVTMTQLLDDLNSLYTTVYTPGSSGAAGTGLVCELNTQLLAKMPLNANGTGADFLSYMDGYNESLMNVYSNMIQATQMAYNIQSTFLYLAQNSTYFPSWDIPITGIEMNSTYSNNQNTLNTYYEGLYQTAFNYVSQYVLTDSYDTVSWRYGSDLPFTYQGGFYPNKVSTLPLMRPDNTNKYLAAAPWSTSCVIYAWEGASSNPYTGVYANNTITARGNAQIEQMAFTQNLSLSAALSTGMNLYFGGVIGNDEGGWLQFETYNSTYLQNLVSGTTFNSSAGYAQTSMGHGVTVTIDGSTDQGWSASPQAFSIYYIASDGFNYDQSTNTCTCDTYDNNWVWVIYGYTGPGGLSTWFRLGQEVQSGCSDMQYIWQLQAGNGANATLVAPSVALPENSGNVLQMGGANIELTSPSSNTCGTSLSLSPIKE